MTKFLLLVLLGVIAYLLWVGARRKAGRARPGAGPESPERMVDCSQCGLHLPVSEAVQAEGRFFCSDEHRRLYQR